jgi:hypothetical protein
MQMLRDQFIAAAAGDLRGVIQGCELGGGGVHCVFSPASPGKKAPAPPAGYNAENTCRAARKINCYIELRES